MDLEVTFRDVCRVSLAVAVAVLFTAASAGPALGARTGSAGQAKAAPVFPVPASARVHGETTGKSPPATGAGAQGGIPVPRAGSATPQPPSVPPTPTPSSSSTTPSSSPTYTSPSTSALPRAGTPSTLRPGVSTLHRRSSTRLSRGALIGAVLAGLLVLLCAVWALVRWLAIEPRWTRSLAYSLEEAGSRASATWAELLDWARLGR